MLWETARAKVNLCLHVTGRRANGLHSLESLVVFAAVGDRVGYDPDGEFGLDLSGPFAPALGKGRNLILDAAKLLSISTGRFYLEKNLPVAAGIGGGSSDAAAALRLLCQHRGISMPTADSLMSLGADVPVCVGSRSGVMRGAGEVFTPVTLPDFGLVLVNPKQPVATADVFRQLASRQNPAMDPFPQTLTFESLAIYLQRQRNDLQDTAIMICPVIRHCLDATAALSGCALARLSGSGATVFGVFVDQVTAQQAADQLRQDHPDWWVVSG